MRTRSKAVIAAMALAGIWALAAPVASEAKTKHYPTTLTAKATSNVFSGQVLSVPRCVPGRGVTVYNAVGVPLGGAVTDAFGNWQVPLKAISAGGYYAGVTQRRFKQHGHKRVCSETFSPGFTARRAGTLRRPARPPRRPGAQRD